MKSLKRIKTCLMAAMFAAVLSVMAAPVVTPEPSGSQVPQVPRSVFNLPASPKEGRDPFFPNSLRPYEGAAVPSRQVTDVHALIIQGFSGVPPNQLVIINNVTFGVGDDAEVRTPEGRIRIHCVGINGSSAVIEVSGQQHTLQYGGKP